MNEQEYREVAAKAADAMEKYGWVSGTRSQYEERQPDGGYGRMCVLGAVAFGKGLHPHDYLYLDRDPILEWLLERLSLSGRNGVTAALAYWSNNDPAHGKTVINCLRRIAEEPSESTTVG